MTSPDRPADIPVQRPGVEVPDVPDVDQPFDAEGLYALRATVAAHTERLGVVEEQAEAVLIVASELATNAVRHGGGAGRLRLWLRDGTLYCRVNDAGVGIVDARVGTTAPDLVGSGGRGMWICRQLCDEVVIETVDASRGAAITAVMRVDAKED
jgi:anti-sigma regulatory factor (Ser/Thr protein kinase)